jgi:hypothetical protein
MKPPHATRSSFIATVLTALACLTAGSLAIGDDEEEDLLAAAQAAAKADPKAMEVRFNDESRMKFILADERIEVASRYGTLQIVASDIRKIDFALRLSDSTKRQIDDAISELGNTDAQVRKAALRRLAALGPIAYPSLAKVAVRGENAAERRAADLVAKLKETIDPQEFTARELDVIQTVDSTISGHILTPALKAQTSQFGELSVKIADARSLRWQGLVETKPEPEDKNVLPDPGNLYNFPDRSGKALKFRVTGRTDGYVWGSDIYTADSPLATAAVHAGAVKAGQTGVVKVKLIPPPPAFAGSTRNGVTSQDFGAFPEAYQFVK